MVVTFKDRRWLFYDSHYLARGQFQRSEVSILRWTRLISIFGEHSLVESRLTSNEIWSYPVLNRSKVLQVTISFFCGNSFCIDIRDAPLLLSIHPKSESKRKANVSRVFHCGANYSNYISFWCSEICLGRELWFHRSEYCPWRKLWFSPQWKLISAALRHKLKKITWN